MVTREHRPNPVVTAATINGEALLGALVAGQSYANAADAAGCSVSTVKRRINDPEFRVALVEAKNDALDQLLGVSISAARVGTGFLVRIVTGQEPAPVGVRVRAAVSLRDFPGLDRHLRGA